MNKVPTMRTAMKMNNKINVLNSTFIVSSHHVWNKKAKTIHYTRAMLLLLLEIIINIYSLLTCLISKDPI